MNRGTFAAGMPQMNMISGPRKNGDNHLHTADPTQLMLQAQRKKKQQQQQPPTTTTTTNTQSNQHKEKKILTEVFTTFFKSKSGGGGSNPTSPTSISPPPPSYPSSASSAFAFPSAIAGGGSHFVSRSNSSSTTSTTSNANIITKAKVLKVRDDGDPFAPKNSSRTTNTTTSSSSSSSSSSKKLPRSSSPHPLSDSYSHPSHSNNKQYQDRSYNHTKGGRGDGEEEDVEDDIFRHYHRTLINSTSTSKSKGSSISSGTSINLNVSSGGRMEYIDSRRRRSVSPSTSLEEEGGNGEDPFHHGQRTLSPSRGQDRYKGDDEGRNLNYEDSRYDPIASRPVNTRHYDETSFPKAPSSSMTNYQGMNHNINNRPLSPFHRKYTASPVPGMGSESPSSSAGTDHSNLPHPSSVGSKSSDNLFDKVFQDCFNDL